MPAIILVIALLLAAACLFVMGVYVIGGLGPALIAASACSASSALALRRGLIVA